MKNFSLFLSYVLICTMSLVSGCSKKPTQEPTIGEYGQNRVFYQNLSSEQIDEINLSSMPNPQNLNTIMLEDIHLIPTQSPYRVVVVAKGTSLQNGEVKVRFNGGIESQNTSSQVGKKVGMGNLIENTESEKYTTNQPVLLVMAGGKVQPEVEREGSIALNLIRRENIQFNAIRIEVWQGKGSYSSFWDQWFWLSFLIGPVLLWIGVRNRRR